MRLRNSLLLLSSVVFTGSLVGVGGPSPAGAQTVSLRGSALSLNASQQSADDLYNAAVDLQGARKYDEAIEKYDEAVKKRVVFPDAWLNRGICYLALSKWDPAIENFNLYITRKQNVAIGYINRASAYTGKKMFTEALKDYETALARNPRADERFILYLSRGNTYFNMGDFDRAVAGYTEALATAGYGDLTDRPQAYLNRADAYLKMTPSRGEEARADLVSAGVGIEKAVARNPRNAIACYLYVRMAQVKERAGDPGGAITDYETFLRRQPEHPERPEIEKRIQELKGKSGGQ